MPVIPTKTTYLEMFRMPTCERCAPSAHVSVERWHAPTVEQYRQLYRGVGERLHWVDRLLMPEEQLRAILNDLCVEVYVLSVAGETAGYSELDRRSDNEIELAYFGLFPPFIGQGLGKFFLNWTLQQAWSHKPRRVWVHTCDLDHPAALPTYLKAGFQVYDERLIQQLVPISHGVF